ncbi:hypothetical protein ABE096_03920 [Robertmurraya massiliosenegalensis]|uniref:DUF7695 domain-containing protein n=1 Tax=Bacillaceae TaxID=186817 RepID=UPI00031783AF|nr:hypothetical protein [Robertmurraya massiliosenegalensis]
MFEKKLKRNMIRCKYCGDVIESRSLYDFKRCKCGKVTVDGGLEYAKRSFSNNPPENHFEELSEFE